MASVTINFTNGKPLHLDMIKYQAEDLLMALAEHPDGATIISDENKKPLHVIRRGQVTFVTIEP
jgi:hypothetical protein